MPCCLFVACQHCSIRLFLNPPYLLSPPSSTLRRSTLQSTFQDPVIAADGFTYEREAITNWLATFSHCSPVTGLPLPHMLLVSNIALRNRLWME